MAARSHSTTTLKRQDVSGEPPTRIAAIDVGATSMRLAIAEVLPDGSLRQLEQLVHPVALGTETFSLGYITAASMLAAGQVLANFSRVMKEYKVTQSRAVATSAIREATNKDVLIDRIRHESGVTLEVLDGVGETRLSYQVLLPFLRANIKKKSGYTLLLDLGGGSTEMMALKGTNLIFVDTRRLGTARLFHHAEKADCGDRQAFIETTVRNVVDSMLDLIRQYPADNLIVVNSLLNRVFSREEGAVEVEGGLRIPARIIDSVSAEASEASLERLCERFRVDRTGAELLGPALTILSHLTEGSKVRAVHLAEVDLLSAVLYDMANTLAGRDFFTLFSQQVLGSAMGVAEKYRCDLDHSRSVSHLSCQIYDGLCSFLDLGGKHKLYLEAAAILHDCGMFVSEYAHHKHSGYLIEWSEIVGLGDDERKLVSMIARYHRKSPPRPQHPEFANLPAPDRLLVIKLAAILRLADALDRGHRQVVKNVAVELEEESMVLVAEAVDDLSVETLALKDKGAFFEEITGLKVGLRRCYAKI